MTLEETRIPNKYKELIGLAMSAATRCKYCTYYHTEVAKLFGATDEEIEEAMHFNKQVIGWSTYINGMQLDYDKFTQEIDQAGRACEKCDGSSIGTFCERFES